MDECWDCEESESGTCWNHMVVVVIERREEG